MSTEESCAIAIDIQHGSSFFTIPIELRRAVYAHLFAVPDQHIRYIADGGDGVQHFRLTPCIAPMMSDKRIRYGDERNPGPGDSAGFAPKGPLYMRRLLSSWGPHWMCEELACHSHNATDIQSMLPPSNDFSTALSVCKRMYLDLVKIATASTDFHIGDLPTLKALLDRTKPALARFGFEGSICPSITRLSITLSLPLSFFQAMESASLASRDQHSVSPSSQEDEPLGTWSRVASRLLIQLPRIRKLRVWLDHNGTDYWSVVNERAILAPMEELKTTNPGLELVCVLPKVHPRIESPQRHYLPREQGEPTSSPFRLVIHRVLRQRYRVVENDITGRKYVTYVSDFPHILGNPLFDYMSLAEKEEFEGGIWRAGLDVDQMGFDRHVRTVTFNSRMQ